jgi:hypothetical protein
MNKHEFNTGEDMTGYQSADGKIRMLVVPGQDGKQTVIYKVDGQSISDYLTEAYTELDKLGYKGERKEFAKDISIALYAEACGEKDTPRTVFWGDDSKNDVLTKIRDVVAYQKYGKTMNQYPRMKEILPKFNLGIVKEDPFGMARGEALICLIAKTHEKTTSPKVYFDTMRRFPQYTSRLLSIIRAFNISERDFREFDINFSLFLEERFEKAIAVLQAKKPGAKPWESWPLDENPIWQKYIKDNEDYRGWLDKGIDNQNP